MEEFHREEKDRPLECTACRKQVKVLYTLVIRDTVTEQVMCADCPELKRRLQGSSTMAAVERTSGETGLACGTCGTTLEMVKMGQSLGCSTCYSIFSDFILQDLISQKCLPDRVEKQKKTIPLHIGKIRGKVHTMNTSLRLLALSEALQETLKREDYEEAARLRDQIKELTENHERTDGEISL
jgi:protein arginine kinase activator